MLWIPGGSFMMGTDDPAAPPNERPAHPVKVSGFWMSRHHVTNAEFRAFVESTGYVTTAERPVDWEAMRRQLPPDIPKPPDEMLQPGSLVFVPTERPVPLDDWSQWWRWVPGASWRHPQGPDSDIAGRDDYPVVQVSLQDAQAYAGWRRMRLPTEAEWEFAARGGLEGKRYAWGDNPEPEGRARTWQGTFPVRVSFRGLAPVGRYPPNGYGLFDMAGNAWHWTSDRYRADQFASSASVAGLLIDPVGPQTSYDPTDPLNPSMIKHVIRGGSFLCNPAYCESYRTSARRGESPDSSTSHIGFRLVLSPQV